MAVKVTSAQPLSLTASPDIPRLSVYKSTETDVRTVLSGLSACKTGNNQVSVGSGTRTQ